MQAEESLVWVEASSSRLVFQDRLLLWMGFQKSEVDLNLCFIFIGDDQLILLLYVDDLFITGDERPIAVCKRDFASEYEMVNIGLMHYFLGLEVWKEHGHIS